MSGTGEEEKHVFNNVFFLRLSLPFAVVAVCCCCCCLPLLLLLSIPNALLNTVTCCNLNLLPLFFPRYRPNKKNLKIRSVTKDDTGTYVCKGTNGFGSTEAQIDLIVIGNYITLHYITFFYFYFHFVGNRRWQLLYCQLTIPNKTLAGLTFGLPITSL